MEPVHSVDGLPLTCKLLSEIGVGGVVWGPLIGGSSRALPGEDGPLGVRSVLPRTGETTSFVLNQLHSVAIWIRPHIELLN